MLTCVLKLKRSRVCFFTMVFIMLVYQHDCVFIFVNLLQINLDLVNAVTGG